MKDKKAWYEAKQMSQDQAINFAYDFYPFGKSLLIFLAKPKIWPAICYWQAAILIFPCLLLLLLIC